MLETILPNLSTFIIALFLIVLIAALVLKIHHDKKSGKHSCSGCSGCKFPARQGEVSRCVQPLEKQSKDYD